LERFQKAVPTEDQMRPQLPIGVHRSPKLRERSLQCILRVENLVGLGVGDPLEKNGPRQEPAGCAHGCPRMPAVAQRCVALPTVAPEPLHYRRCPLVALRPCSLPTSPRRGRGGRGYFREQKTKSDQRACCLARSRFRFNQPADETPDAVRTARRASPSKCWILKPGLAWPRGGREFQHSVREAHKGAT
jgi:hypothetical protein